MEEARIKILNIRRKLYAVQKYIMEFATSNGAADYKDPRIRTKHGEAIILEFVLEGWTEKYRYESKMFWSGHNLNESGQ